MASKFPPNARLGAARVVLDLGIHQHEANVIVRRLEDLEAQHRAQGLRDEAAERVK
jgi:hypothetical protein